MGKHAPVLGLSLQPVVSSEHQEVRRVSTVRMRRPEMSGKRRGNNVVILPLGLRGQAPEFLEVFAVRGAD